LGKREYSESDIIEGCRKGKRQSQELLYHHYFGFGMSVCLRYTSFRDDALEVLNDSFMKVFSHIHDYDITRPFKSWFRRILVNTALDHYRVRKSLSWQVSYDDPANDVDRLSGDSHQHETSLKLDADAILALFNGLPDVYRLTFNLYEIEGYSHDEIAGMLNISPGTSRSHLSRAKKMLRELYHRQKKERCHEAV